MGAVFRAIDPLIEREVALKTLLPELPEEVVAEVRERFLREARSAGRLNHPNIVIIHDVGEQDGVAYIAMELLEGRSLQQMLKDPQRIPLQTTADLAAQIADALEHAHKFSIVHRDVKPANVMVAASGRCKLTDFGVAYVPSSTMTQTGAALGSPKYMSPEQVLGQKSDPRSDVFSLGRVAAATLSEAWCDSRPRRIEGKDYCEHVMLRFRVSPQPPARVTLQTADIPRFEQYLKGMKAAYDLRVDARSDFGEATRATFTVRSGLLCEVELRADYEALAVTIDTTNVRRIGTIRGRIPATAVTAMADELARYALGVDTDFAKRLTAV